MGLYEFNVLPQDTQLATIWQTGEFLETRFDESHSINLYSLFDFYAEVYYNPTTNTIDTVRTFKSADCLEPYLPSISIESLL